MNNSIENAAQSIKGLRDAGVDLDALPNLSCDECSQLAAKVIPYAENKAQPAPDRSLGHKHEVNRDAVQRMQASRERLPRRGSVRKCNQRRDSMQKRLASMKR